MTHHLLYYLYMQGMSIFSTTVYHWHCWFEWWQHTAMLYCG